MNATDEPSVLAVCLPELRDYATDAGLDVQYAASGREAIELLRVLRFDLVLTGQALPDMSAAMLLARVRTAWPWQKSVLVCSELSESQERQARSLGVVSILDGWPSPVTVSSVVESLGRRTAQLCRPRKRAFAKPVLRRAEY